jgi:hypothetical protein
MTDLLDEVTEDLKNEQQATLVRKITRLFSICAVIITLGASGYAWKEHSTTKLQNQLGEWFSQAMLSADENKLDEAINYFDKIIEFPHQQYAALAYFNKANILFKQNKFDQGQESLLAIYQQKQFDLSIRELAQIIYLSNQLPHGGIKNEKLEESLAKLTEESKPWKLLALQLKAMYEIRDKNFIQAKNSINKILESKQATKASQNIASSILSSISRTE